ncbi:hypothetical protein SAMN05421595_1192 [Austwickia chelonae]|uniref:Uncharacterized protein n=1 Tax=Austwickia chelonae NBRC 105200 TaxID=1184607 RepID=K6VKT9_9MICO|nr:hypothetical protein [Austwickia chelonae]GAB77364.1 hypothetical protein AUCHE_05_02730 [Austwickia chelonae NBRC 105200]SEW08753.1 hypothetical protein SAMN05421595_1192 [Austwickia chelonae]
MTTTFALMAVYIVLLYMATDYFRRNYRVSLWFWAAAIGTFPIWIVTGQVEGWFRWVKTLTVLSTIIVLGLMRVSMMEKRPGRFWEFLRSPKWMWFLYGVLSVNILEAALKDLETGNVWNFLTGVLLCVTIPFAPKFMGISDDGRADLIAYTTGAWNFLYTTWNLNFTYGEAGPHFAGSLCILLAAELYPLVKRQPELYYMARAYTLAIHLFIRANWDFFPAYMSSAGWFRQDVWLNWGLINFLLMIPYLFWYTWQLHTGRADVTFRRGRARSEFLENHPEFAVEPRTAGLGQVDHFPLGSLVLPDNPRKVFDVPEPGIPRENLLDR